MNTTLKHFMLVLFFAFACVVPIMKARATEVAQAETFDQRKLLVPHKNADGTIKVVPFFTDPALWVRQEQQNFYGAMSKNLRSIRDGDTVASGLTLMLLSFGYGVFHAAGPGHGKAVISGWLLATESQLRRGLLVAFMSAVVQAFTAILIVTSLYFLVASVSTAAKDVAGFLETGSFALIAVMGGYLLWTGLQPFFTAAKRGAAAISPQMQSDHHFVIINQHTHNHDADCDCGHAHVPAAKDVSANLTLSKAFSLAFAVGIRPCTGALLVLVFANSIGIYWAGVASTFAMAFGTFITVSCVAALAVYSKKLAERWAKKDARWLGMLTTGLRLTAGTGILLFGLILMIGSFYGPTGSM